MYTTNSGLLKQPYKQEAGNGARSVTCANRHCPKCQSLKRAAWVDSRQADILDVEYFHVVFTVPRDVAALAAQNTTQVYNILFRATAETLRTIAADPTHLGAEMGCFAVLHTWGQTLIDHPPLHGVIPGGGLSPDGTQWVACRPGFFLPVRVLSRLFRRLFLPHLQAAYDTDTLRFEGSLAPLPDRPTWTRALAGLRQTEWVVYAKRPFGGPQQVLDDVGRDTHRVAISIIGCSTSTGATSASPTRTTAPSPRSRHRR